MYTKAKSIEDLISKSPYQEVMEKVDEMVSSNTNLERHYFDNGKTFSAISYGRIGDLGRKNYAYADAGVININTQKNFVGLYIWVNGGDGKIIEKYADQLPKSAMGKGCINIKNIEFLNKYEDIIKQVILDVDKITIH
ncbi:hypothetical protein RD055328_01340 [Companilactobacillus sp. RD055328]|uniref:DUF1801 domain-containing protein n=1 Tax=Companilactobacillus sp. RD055328 TaxID=2916634 RepID=UPI001FC85782|nr:DUF1801 domain-containing protein [Companilactobacillus sp. RD055328]GKQ42211.1 hypothetical protein RD055328_01340 [Companilactobacillus sp. RD055328]